MVWCRPVKAAWAPTATRCRAREAISDSSSAEIRVHQGVSAASQKVRICSTSSASAPPGSSTNRWPALGTPPG